MFRSSTLGSISPRAALVVVGAMTALVIRGWKYPALRRTLALMLAVIATQFALGVATLLSVLNIWLASAHQVVALALLGCLVRLIYLCPLDVNQRPSKNMR
jgi:cytochrome c oxidase assembly protein subunit 15